MGPTVWLPLPSPHHAILASTPVLTFTPLPLPAGPWSATASHVAHLSLRLRKEHSSVLADVLLTPVAVLLTSACVMGGWVWHLAVAARR